MKPEVADILALLRALELTHGRAETVKVKRHLIALAKELGCKHRHESFDKEFEMYLVCLLQSKCGYLLAREVIKLWKK